MFDLSWGEMGVIVVTAAIVIGPKDLPVVLRKAGRAWAKMKHFGGDLRRQFDESPLGAELRAAEAEVARETHELRRTHTILGTDGTPYETYTLDDFVDSSRAQGPTPMASNSSSPLEGGGSSRLQQESPLPEGVKP